MTIITKYDVGDEVWTMERSKPIQMVIKHIEINVNYRFKVNILYQLTGGRWFERNLTERLPQQLFSTKEELLKSL